ncbi:glycosyltransferase family 1 protein, partial [Acidobacteriota bacterium]
MKVLLINKFLFPKGGDATCTLDTGDLLCSHNHKVIFWGMHHELNQKFPLNEYFISNIKFNNSSSIKNQQRIALNLLYSKEAKKKISKIVELEKPDIVHLNNFAHQISPSILHIFKKYGIPVVMTMHDFKLVCPAYSMLFNNTPCERCKNGKYY